jgi:hypothetical protein
MMLIRGNMLRPLSIGKEKLAKLDKSKKDGEEEEEKGDPKKIAADKSK